MAKANTKRVEPAPPPKATVSNNKKFALLIFCFSFLLYSNSIFNDYNLDDELVTRNHRLTSRGISAIPEIFSSPYYQDAMGYSYEYRPVVLSSFAIEHSLFGENPHVGHFINVVLYALICVLLFYSLSLLFSEYSALVPLAITLLFCAHTAHTEVVCSIKNRDELLGFGFGVLSVYAIWQAVHKRSFMFYIIGIIAFIFATLSKNTSVNFIFVISLSLVFFSSIPLKHYVFIQIILLFPLLFLVNIGSGTSKLTMVLAVFSFNLFLYALSKLAIVKAVTALMLQRLRSLFDNTVREKKITSENNAISFSSFRFPKQINIEWKKVVLVILLATIYTYTFFSGATLWSVVPFSILFIFSIKGNKNISWLAYTALFYCLSLNLVRFYNLSAENEELFIYSYTLILFLCSYLLIQTEKQLFLPSLVVLLGVVMLSGTTHLFESIGVVFLIYFMRFRKFLLFSTLVLVGLLLAEFIQLKSLSDITLILLIVYLLTLYNRKAHQIAVWFIGLILYAYFLSVSIIHPPKPSIHTDKIVSTSISIIAKRIDSTSPAPIYMNQDRPIHFVENCALKSDPLSVRIGTSAIIILHYLKKVIVPFPLAFYYGYSIIEPEKITSPISIFSIGLHLILLIFALFIFRRRPILSFGISLYLVTLVIFSNFFIPLAGMIGDRYLLLPSLGICIAIVGFFTLLLNIRKTDEVGFLSFKNKQGFIFLGILSFYSVLTFSRNLDWEDDLVLFRHDIHYVGKSSQAHNLLALHLMKKSEETSSAAEQLALSKEALSHFMQAKSIYPNFFNVTFDIGRVYLKLNMTDSALFYFQKAVAINSSYSTAFNYIGDICFTKQMYSEAITAYEKLILLEPQNYLGYNKLSYTCFMIKDYSKAISVCKTALKAVPNEYQPLLNISRIYLAQNNMDSARYYLGEAKKLIPNNTELNKLEIEISKK